jgi:hypothetical protein
VHENGVRARPVGRCVLLIGVFTRALQRAVENEPNRRWRHWRRSNKCKGQNTIHNYYKTNLDDNSVTIKLAWLAWLAEANASIDSEDPATAHEAVAAIKNLHIRAQAKFVTQDAVINPMWI